MRIEKIAISNYRQLKSLELQFTKKESSDLHVIIGQNGTGKTSILNAINWCLYGDEPHLLKGSDQLPLLNTGVTSSAISPTEYTVETSIWAKSDDGNKIIFTRKWKFRACSTDSQPRIQSKSFEVRTIGIDGNTKIMPEDEASIFVDRFVPNRIREFFFFDGERLDRYFAEATGVNIRKAVYEISQIDLLGKIEDRLDKISKEYSGEAGKLSPRIEEVRTKIESLEKHSINIQSQLNECNGQISIAKEKISELDDKLRGIPDLRELEAKRESYKSTLSKKRDIRGNAVRDRQDFLFNQSIYLMLAPAIIRGISMINEKRKKREIPPSIDINFINDVLKTNVCGICGRKINEEERCHIASILESIRLSSDVAQQLLMMEGFLYSAREKYSQFQQKAQEKHIQIEVVESEISGLEKDIEGIDNLLSSYDVEKIKLWSQERRDNEAVQETNTRKAGSLKRELEESIKILESEKVTLEQELKKDERFKAIRKKIKFSKKAYAVIRQIKEAAMEEIRRKIAQETKTIFLDLVWKKESFKDVTFDEGYNINIVHSNDIGCLGSMSSGERELLALAFTLALHKVSGFDSAIMIDTPVARISDTNRENFARVFAEIGKKKQVILLFTPSEYSKEISNEIDKAACTKVMLKVSSKENETLADRL
jgi:DNA sulfur modification protein DndD